MDPIGKHVQNHKIDTDCSLAYFVFYPPNTNLNGLNSSSIQSHEKHYDLPRSSVFHTTWAVNPEYLHQAISSIPDHCRSGRDNRTPIHFVLIFLAHCGSGKYTWGNQEIAIKDLLDSCKSISGVDAILLLGCKTAIPELPSINISILATCEDVYYNDCVSFYHTFMDKYFSLSGQKFSRKVRAKKAMLLSYSHGINNKNLHHYF